MKKFLMLSVVALTLSACGNSKDDDVKRCDGIADKYVEYFASEEDAAEVRHGFLRECVQGPEDESDAQRDDWLTCAEEARTGGDLVKCKKVYQHEVKKATVEELSKLAKEIMTERLCKGTKDDDENLEELEDKAEELEDKAHEVGVDGDELREAMDLVGDKDFEEFKTELCKGITPPAEEAPAAEPEG